jgi:hypothetical protein
MTTNGKGSTRRPCSVSQDEFASRWNETFRTPEAKEAARDFMRYFMEEYMQYVLIDGPGKVINDGVQTEETEEGKEGRQG